jgi:Spy/CpxP family protein refolding chaperone
VRKPLMFVAASCVFTLFTLGIVAPAAAQPPRPQPASTSIDEVLKAVRSDLVDNHADALARNLTLTSAQAAAFWPLYKTYQEEQAAILDEQLKGIQQFIEQFDTMESVAALTLIKEHFRRDADMTALREKWLGDFQKVLGTKLAVRVMQIDRRVSLIQQFQLTTKIPLAQ